jgi:hypothetical protein
MDTTPREIWYWLTAGALEKLRLIQAFPLDAPISYWLQVAAAGFFWIVVRASTRPGPASHLLLKRRKGDR